MPDFQSPTQLVKVLVVDDERTTRLAIAEALRQLGYDCNTAESGEEAIEIFQRQAYHVAILDLHMTGLTGVDVLNAADKIAPHTEFIILTAHASTDTAIAALRSGAVDYLRKPSSLQNIAAAVAKAAQKQQDRARQEKAVALLQQAASTLQIPQPEPITPPPSSANQHVIYVGPVQVDSQKQTATYQGAPLDLTPIEYRLLHYLATHADVICSYSDLGIASHNIEMDEVEARGLLRTHMYRLVRKLGGKENSPLQGVWGRGFILHTDPKTAVSDS